MKNLLQIYPKPILVSHIDSQQSLFPASISFIFLLRFVLLGLSILHSISNCFSDKVTFMFVFKLLCSCLGSWTMAWYYLSWYRSIKILSFSDIEGIILLNDKWFILKKDIIAPQLNMSSFKEITTSWINTVSPTGIKDIFHILTYNDSLILIISPQLFFIFPTIAVKLIQRYYMRPHHPRSKTMHLVYLFQPRCLLRYRNDFIKVSNFKTFCI